MTREPAVAGQFYPGNPGGLKAELERLFSGASTKLSGNSLAVISPHAGYVYSGGVAASAFMQVDPDKEYENIFVIGSSHRYAFNGASVYTHGNFRTPLGEVPVNIKQSRELIAANPFISDRSDAQINEHSLEVQLPFLQFWLRKKFQIIPIVIATQQASTCREIARTLKPYFVPSNLFVISTDFSHYPGYDDACRIDRQTAEAILTNNPEGLLKSIAKNEHAGIPGLSTCLCGWTSVLTLLYLTENIQGIQYRLVDYRNSGDAAGMENKSRVVGYYAISVGYTETLDNKDVTGMIFSQGDRKVLLDLARNAIITRLAGGERSGTGSVNLSAALKQHAGVFVSLYRQGKLRGCIGRFTPDLTLYELIQEIAIASSIHDHRFPPVTKEEIDELKIEISVLTPLKRIAAVEEIELGRHGIYIRKGHSSGTYLPQVAVNTGWSKEEFVEHCSSDKAGIGRNGWKEAELFTYEAIIIKEE